MPRPFGTRIPRVRQHDATDCGAACLAAIAEFHGLRLPVARVRQIAATDREGTSVRGLLDAAAALGFTAKGVRGDDGALPRIPLPAIAHLVLPDGLQHFVVLHRVTSTHVQLMDPSDGVVRHLPRGDFVARWSGVLVLLLPADSFRRGNARASVVGRFWNIVQPHRTVMWQALAGAAVHTILGLSTAVFVL